MKVGMDASKDSAPMNHQNDCDGNVASTCEISVVIPVYRSEATLELLFERLLPVLNQLGRTYEVVLVEDGSPDRSWTAIEALHRRHPSQIVAIQLMRNYGQHNALMCGFRHSRGELVVTMDDDLQNPPEEIPRLLEEIERSDRDLVYGNYAEKQHESYRNLGSMLVNRFYRTVFRSQATVTSFRIVRRPLLAAIMDYRRSFVFVDGLMAWNTQRVGSALVEHHPRQEGRSTYSFSKLLALATNLFTGFSLMPLQIASVMGVATALAGLVFGAYYVYLSLIGGDAVVCAPFVTALLMVFGGMQMLSLGVMGEYLGRVHMNINGKPQYRERQVLGIAVSNDAWGLPL